MALEISTLAWASVCVGWGWGEGRGGGGRERGWGELIFEVCKVMCNNYTIYL